jgi:hypothetical protein
MDRRNFQYFEMLTRVVEFGEAHLDLFPKSTLAEKTFAQLGAALSNVSEHAGSQVTSRNSVHARTKVRDAAHHALRAQLRRLSDTARAIAIDTPGIDEQFRMPDRKRAQALLLGAKAFADAAGPIKKEFIQHGIPNGFIDDLHEAANGLEAAIQEQASNKTKRVSTGKALNDNLAECLKLLIRLDAVVKNTLVDNELALAEWNTARRVRRVSSRSTRFQCDQCPTALTKFSASGAPTPVTASHPGVVTSDESVPNVSTNHRVENGLL